jgi:serine/threonine protein kinase
VGEQLFESQQGERAAMERELRMLQTIDHPNLVNLVGVILDAPMPNAIVLEYLPNGSVFDLLYMKQVRCGRSGHLGPGEVRER